VSRLKLSPVPVSGLVETRRNPAESRLTMKVHAMKKIIISTLLLSAFSAFANETGDELQNRIAFQSNLTRAEVRVDYLRAKAAGTLVDTSEAASQQSQAVSQSVPRGSLKAAAAQAARTRVIHELM
jgi:hypothetical protein